MSQMVIIFCMHEDISAPIATDHRDRSQSRKMSRLHGMISRLRSKISRNHSNKEHFSSGPTPCGLFGRLPQELRDIIYEDVFSAGHISLTRSSRALYENSKLALSKHGVYRVRSNWKHWNYIVGPWRHPQTPMADRILTVGLE